MDKKTLFLMYLKDRKERCLNPDDTRTYCRLVTAIGITLAIQQELDTVYADVEDTLALTDRGTKSK